MKCPRCGNQMKRQQQADHSFIYFCPICRYQIGKKDEEEQIAENQEQEQTTG